MKIHELAHLSGVNPETIRMYRQKGLLHPARLANGYFDYSACNLYELMFVRKLRGANLGLETIASFYGWAGRCAAEHEAGDPCTGGSHPGAGAA